MNNKLRILWLELKNKNFIRVLCFLILLVIPTSVKRNANGEWEYVPKIINCHPVSLIFFFFIGLREFCIAFNNEIKCNEKMDKVTIKAK